MDEGGHGCEVLQTEKELFSHKFWLAQGDKIKITVDLDLIGLAHLLAHLFNARNSGSEEAGEESRVMMMRQRKWRKTCASLKTRI